MNDLLIFLKSGYESKNLIELFMDRNPKKRPDFKAIKSHKSFEKIDWTKLNLKKITPPKL